MTEQNKTRIFLTYDPIHGEPMADGLAGGFVETVVTSVNNSYKDHHIVTASTLVVDYFRLAVKKKELTPNTIEVTFKGQTIPMFENGRFEKLPVGFCDIGCDILMQL